MRPFVIAYDFDGTLAPGNMQERDFIPSLGISNDTFWAETHARAQACNGDHILAYMGLMLEKAQSAHLSVKKDDIKAYGQTLTFFPGVEDWFARINTYGASKGLAVQHAIISSGIREMIEGTTIAPAFTHIFASGFFYDHNGIATWPALAVNYTTKTQFLFRINKGCPDVSDTKAINQFVPQAERPVPFTNMVYIGDGDTDIPCFGLVKQQGGHAIAVYPESEPHGPAKCSKLMAEGRVNFATTANYTQGSPLETRLHAIINKVAADEALRTLGKAL